MTRNVGGEETRDDESIFARTGYQVSHMSQPRESNEAILREGREGTTKKGRQGTPRDDGGRLWNKRDGEILRETRRDGEEQGGKKRGEEAAKEAWGTARKC